MQNHHDINEEALFALNVKQRRETVEKVTITACCIFLLNVLLSYFILTYFLEHLDKFTYKHFSAVYAWNIIFMGAVVYIFNKYKY